jgi:hypothetical protein
MAALLCCVAAFGQNMPVPQGVSVLKSQDIDKFIETLKPMSEELESLGVSLDNQENQNFGAAIQGNAQAWAVVKKYGWDESFAVKWMAISLGYAQIKIEEQLQMVPEGQREQTRQMMQMAMDQMGGEVGKEDMKLIESNYERLDEFMTNFENN